MGFKAEQVEDHEEAQNLYGYQGDKRAQKANIIVRRKYVGGSSNDIGFEKKEDGTYAAIISDYDRGRYNDQWMKKLESAYGQEQAKDAFTTHGWTYQETRNEEGETVLVGTPS